MNQTSHLYNIFGQIGSMADAYHVADICYRIRPDAGTVKDALTKLATSRAAYRDYAIAKLENYAFLEGIQL